MTIPAVGFLKFIIVSGVIAAFDGRCQIFVLRVHPFIQDCNLNLGATLLAGPSLCRLGKLGGILFWQQRITAIRRWPDPAHRMLPDDHQIRLDIVHFRQVLEFAQRDKGITFRSQLHQKLGAVAKLFQHLQPVIAQQLTRFLATLFQADQ